MKKIFKVFLWFFIVILGLLLSLVIFLNIYYSILEKRMNKVENSLEVRSEIIPNPIGTTSDPSQQSVLNLIPVPKKIQLTGGYFVFPPLLAFSVADSMKSDVEGFFKMFPDIKTRYSDGGGAVQCKYVKALPAQGYNLDINTDRIIIEYSNIQGLYYAMVSLKVLNRNYEGKIPCAYIEDSPDLAVRGMMLDISRDKVPTRETILDIAQLLADLKYNHLELYIEGFSFAYPAFAGLWEGKETPVTGEDIQTIDAFCRANFIDFVPNQNSLGHMQAWLATDQFKELAECPNGYKMMGLINMKTTLNPGDPGSIDLVSKMTDDLLPNFTSSSFNVNLDEPFELGKGKSKELCKSKGEGAVYLDYAMRLHEIVTGKNRKMLMWGDIVLKHPELIASIPKDITLLDWGYEAGYPYERHCKMLQTAGLKYMVCPGTNSWTSITGRTDNMIATIESATANGFRYGAEGMLLTDWGDMGHWQYLPVSYAGYVAGAALSWNSSSSKEMPLSSFLNSYVFMDDSRIMGSLVLDMGRYSRFEEIPLPNMTTTMMSFQFGLRDKVMVNAIFDKVMNGISDLMKDLAPEMVSGFKEKFDNRHQFDYTGLKSFIDSKEELLGNVRMKTSDSTVIRDEYRNAIRLIRLGTGLQSFIKFRDNMTYDDERSQLLSMKDILYQYLAENKRLWLLRNKPGGYDRSTSNLYILKQQIEDRLQVIEKPTLTKSLNRFLERVGTAGAAIYLKLS
jgi:hexosaminidase